VDYEGKRLVPGQSNNAYIFPGVGLGVTACRIRHVTDEMFFAAAKTLAGRVEDGSLAKGSLYPPLKDIRKVSLAIAEAVAEVAYKQKLAGKPKPKCLHDYLAGQMYDPVYEK
jgi:malate dehydrogenase (oxaloacetate-decarboxylating)(NADP+)